jgi:hypothetical protein
LVEEIRGSVAHLPYEFTIRALRRSDADPGSLVVNVVDPATRRSIPGYPRAVPDWMQALSERHGMEIPVTEAQKSLLVNAGLTKDKAGTYVNLVIGADLVK